jgi:hypothetical protein
MWIRSARCASAAHAPRSRELGGESCDEGVAVTPPYRPQVLVRETGNEDLPGCVRRHGVGLVPGGRPELLRPEQVPAPVVPLRDDQFVAPRDVPYAILGWREVGRVSIMEGWRLGSGLVAGSR